MADDTIVSVPSENNGSQPQRCSLCKRYNALKGRLSSSTAIVDKNLPGVSISESFGGLSNMFNTNDELFVSTEVS